jgi:hypothetical protein
MEQDPTVVFKLNTRWFHVSDSARCVSRASLWHVNIPTQLGTVTKNACQYYSPYSHLASAENVSHSMRQYGQCPLNLLKYDDEEQAVTSPSSIQVGIANEYDCIVSSLSLSTPQRKVSCQE